MESSLEKLTGIVERVTFQSPDSGYTVFQVKSKDPDAVVTVVGFSERVVAGIAIESSGNWRTHPQYGLQFEAKTIDAVLPTTQEGIERYLASGVIKGIGPHIASLLVGKYGVDVFNVIETKPQSLRSIKGIGRARAEMITKAWGEQRFTREILAFLHSYGVSASLAQRIFKRFGEQSIAKITENPYCLAQEIDGIGFKTADSIAKNIGISPDSLTRSRAAVTWLLSEQMARGHVAYPREKLVKEVVGLLTIPEERVVEAIAAEKNEKKVVEETIGDVPCLYLEWLARAEKEVARRLKGLLRQRVPWGTLSMDRALEWAEDRLSIALDNHQKKAIRLALESKVLVITGGPGTGKTTITRAIVNILRKKRVAMDLCCPTGRAAKRLSECTGFDARTIHRLLEYAGYGARFSRNEENPLDCDLLIVDEASMVDLLLMRNLLRALPDKAALLFVGDVDQLPSVGPGSVLRSMIDSGVMPVVRLSQVFRQAAESEIIVSAHRINQGVMPNLSRSNPKTDFYFVESGDSQRTISILKRIVSERIPSRFFLDPMSEIQVLSPMNRGALGTKCLNAELQALLNPRPQPTIERQGQRFAVRDKVMVNANDYDKEVFNGDIGSICGINCDDETLAVDFDGRIVKFEFSELDILTLAYAITIHKSQGSEYPAVVIPIAMEHFIMLRRNLLYTAVTRGRRLVVLVGEKRALEVAIGTTGESHRWTNLSYQLREGT